MSESRSRVATLGAQDLATLWSALPVARLSWAIGALPGALPDLSDDLRAAVWRHRCAQGQGHASCVEQRNGNRSPCHAPQACSAYSLIPVEVGGGGTEGWRMARLFLRWLPGKGRLHAWVLGDAAGAALSWIDSWVSDRMGRASADEVWHGRFGERVPVGIETWDLNLVTPLVGSKEGGGFASHLCNSLAERARKFTALCVECGGAGDGALTSRLLAFGSWHISKAALDGGLTVTDERRLRSEDGKRRSGGNDQWRNELRWSGTARLSVSEEGLPWLTILAICGAGKNPDKGFGSVELDPVLDL